MKECFRVNGWGLANVHGSLSQTNGGWLGTEARTTQGQVRKRNERERERARERERERGRDVFNNVR